MCEKKKVSCSGKGKKNGWPMRKSNSHMLWHSLGDTEINVIYVESSKHTTDRRKSGWVLVGVQGPISIIIALVPIILLLLSANAQ